MTEPAAPGAEPPRQPGERREPRFDPSGELADIYRSRAQKSDSELVAERAAREVAERKAAELEAAAADRVKQAERAGDERVMRAELRFFAKEAGVVDADVLKLLDLKAAGVKLDDKGEVVGAKEAIDALKATKPWAFKQTAADQGSTTTTATPPGTSPATGKHAKDMTKAEFDAALSALTRRR